MFIVLFNIHTHTKEHLLDLEEKLFNVFSDDQIPHIHYRRNSNPDRTSITVNITPPEKNEIFFILKCVESKKREDSAKPKPVRQDTPLPRKAHTPTHGFEAEESYLPQLILSDEPVEMETDSILSQLDEAIDTLSNKPNRVRPESTESMLYCNDFGMNDLMVIIRGAAVVTDHNKSIRSEISEVFKDSHTRLDQLEKVFVSYVFWHFSFINFFRFRNWIVSCLKPSKFITNKEPIKYIGMFSFCVCKGIIQPKGEKTYLACTSFCKGEGGMRNKELLNMSKQ